MGGCVHTFGCKKERLHNGFFDFHSKIAETHPLILPHLTPQSSIEFDLYRFEDSFGTKSSKKALFSGKKAVLSDEL